MFFDIILNKLMPEKCGSIKRVGSMLVLFAFTLACGNTEPPVEKKYPFTNFESGHVNPIALTPDGLMLLAVNTPNNSLEIYSTAGDTLVLVNSVAVGIEPVAVAVRNNTEAWVVNHLSDSISVVSLAGVPQVTRTLLVGDEPRDVVFAGTNNDKAFVTTAYRGQNHPTFSNDDLRVPGLARANVFVYDATNLGTSIEGDTLTILDLFTDSPRSLSVSADGSTVYAAGYLSGNQTTALMRDTVLGNKPAPDVNHEGITAPNTSLIVKFNGTQWVDENNTDWSSDVKFNLPDTDLFVINANANPPVVTQTFSGIGTVLYNSAVNPVNGKIYVSNLESINQVRFEGPGHNASSVRGKFVENRITVVSGSTVTPIHLNKHVNFNLAEGQAIPAAEKAKSLAHPLGMQVSPDGNTLYVAAFGSNKIATFNTAWLENNTFQPNAANHIAVPGGGPTGLVLNATGTRLYVATRYNNGLSIINTATKSVINSVEMFDMEPDIIADGRPFLYDAVLTSSNGTTSCGSCHIFGDFDGLAWDLGNPDANMKPNNNAYVPTSTQVTTEFHPMKGPMTTQTFRGIADSGPLHWRGDRTGQNPVVVNGELESTEAAAFKEFSGAFVGLVGRRAELSVQQLQSFTDFALRIESPPNPIRNLDSTLTPEQLAGRNHYFNDLFTASTTLCSECHALEPEKKHFGTNGLMSFEGGVIDEDFKVPHLRNMYQKVGMFGMSQDILGQGNPHTGNQIKGFGYLNDGAIDTLVSFFNEPVFTFPDQTSIANIVDFIMAFDNNVAPVVGQQVTATLDNPANAQIGMLSLRAGSASPDCDLIVKGVVGNEHRGAWLQSDGSWKTDKVADAPNNTQTELNNLVVAGFPLTYTCVPLGTGERLGIDADLDGILDGDEI